ncbi:hypothetical protein JHK87_043257 [Glycine soja]|nr:hypothetical protein JHK87_043257 [Glycine soja]
MEVDRCIHIGLLCVQEDAKDRLTMSDVVEMLASDTMTLPKPKQLTFSIGRMASAESSISKSSKNVSINDVTVSITLTRSSFMLLCSLSCVATCPIINPLLCLFAHCHLKASSFSEGQSNDGAEGYEALPMEELG